LDSGDVGVHSGDGGGGEPDESLVAQLTSMGFSAEQAKKALAQNVRFFLHTFSLNLRD